ncbi:MAG: hypothetical protein V2I34_11330, partial [Bacteroidales bacterium]|nr:hypothetical protein [Bacteroidales bacterium]
MNKADFLNIIKRQKVLSDKEFNDISRISLNYPYFQTAYVILLNALYRRDDIEFTGKLKETAIYVADREVLYKLLNTEDWFSREAADTTNEDEPGPEAEDEQAVADSREEVSLLPESETGLQPNERSKLSDLDEGKEKGKVHGAAIEDRSKIYEPVSGRSREELIREIQTRLSEISGEDILQIDESADVQEQNSGEEAGEEDELKLPG